MILACAWVALACLPSGPQASARDRPTWVVRTATIAHLPHRRGPSATELREVVRAHGDTARLRRWAGAAAVHRWVRATLEEIAATQANPVRAARALALVTVAMNDALVAARRSRGSRRPAPCRLSRTLAPPGGGCPRYAAVPPAATASGAAASVLAALFGDQGGRWRALRRDADAAALASGTTFRAEVRAAARLGATVGAQVLARGRGDGSAAVWTGAPPSGEGYWVPTPSAFAPPLEPLAGTWRPWNLARGGQYRPPPPPAYGTARFRHEADEVWDLSRSLTDDQLRVARFWADGLGTVTPPGHWNLIALALLRHKHASVGRAAEVLALLDTAQTDAFIACWDAKYSYWRIRPVTALRRIAPTWTPLLETPPFPSYTSGHATTSGAASTVLGRFFPDRAQDLRQWASEAAMSRLYAGIHFRSDNDAGLVLGRRVARAALRKLG